MEKTGIIQRVQLTNKSSAGDKGDNLYYHKVWINNGDNGKIALCTEADPQWLRGGQYLTYTIREGQWGNLLYRVVEGSQSSSAPRQNRSSQGNESREELESLIHPDLRGDRQKQKAVEPVAKKSGWGSRLEDQEEYWLIKQNFIAGITCVERATEMLNAGKIQKDEFEPEVRKMFKLIRDLSGLNKLNKRDQNESNESGTPAVEKGKAATGKKAVKVEPAPPAPKLFANEELSSQLPLYLQEALDNCDTQAKLVKFEKNLYDREKEDVNLQKAIENKRNELKGKK